MVRFAVCDDIPADLETSRSLLDDYRRARPAYEIAVNCYDSPYSLLSEFERGVWHDVYLLDILMPGLSGIQVGRALRSQNNRCAIIFGTITPEYSLESYQVSAQNYLLKPFRRETMFRSLDQAVQSLQNLTARGLTVHTEHGVHFLPYQEIIYIENDHRAMVFHLADGRRVASLKLRGKFEDALADPLTEPRFCQSHKSYIVNMDYIRFHTGEHLELLGGVEVPLAEGRRKAVLEQYLDYIRKKR